MAWQAAYFSFYITIYKTSKNKIYKSRHKLETPANNKGLVKTKQANQEIVNHKGYLQATNSNRNCSIKKRTIMDCHGLTRAYLYQEADPILCICCKEGCKPSPTRLRIHNIDIMHYIITELRISFSTVKKNFSYLEAKVV